MSLCLEIVAVNGRPPDPPVRAAFGEAGGSLGRAEDNTLPLPDPDRHISRYHARVICRMGRHFILDGGSSTPVIHNGIVVGMGREAEIRPGDDIRIGQYLLRVAEAADGAALQPERDALSGGGLAAAAPGGRDEHSGAPTISMAVAGGANSTAPFTPGAVWPGNDARSQEAMGGTELQLHGFLEPVTEDAPELAFDADALSESLDPRAIVAALKGQLPPEESWPAPGALPAPQPARSPRTSPGAGGADARAIGEPGLAREGDAAGPEALLRALLDGAGLAPTHAEPLTAAQAHAIGRLLRVCALGVRDLLETGQPTPGGDPGTGAEEATGLWHPLLAAPSAEAAVAMLLGRGAAEAPQGGDSDPVASLQSAFDALRGRDQALPKALRGAFQMALARLRPQSLIAQVTEGRSLVGSIFPGSLKSKLWNAYEKAYEHSREEIDGDFLRALRWELLRLTEESGNSPGTGPAEPA